MMKVFANISVKGRKEALSVLSSNNAIKHGELKQPGLKRKHPPSDFWLYASPFYGFHPDAAEDTLEDELSLFIYANYDLKQFLRNTSSGIDDAYLLIIAAEQTFEETFGCFFYNKTIALLSDIGLGLKIDSVLTMPDFPYWIDCC